MNAVLLEILHGSRATGKAGAASDWDIGVLAEKNLGRDEIFNLKKQLAGKFGVPEEKIDIADLRSDSPLLRYQVAVHGKLIQGDPSDFKSFQIRAWKDYLNNQKFFDLRAKFLNQALHG